MIKKLKSVQYLVLLSYGCVASSFAADFFTIIGPDGRPMVIQQKQSPKKQKAIPIEEKTQEIGDTKSIQDNLKIKDVTQTQAITQPTQMREAIRVDEATQKISDLNEKVKKNEKMRAETKQQTEKTVTQSSVQQPRQDQPISQPKNSIQPIDQHVKSEITNSELNKSEQNPSELIKVESEKSNFDNIEAVQNKQNKIVSRVESNADLKQTRSKQALQKEPSQVIGQKESTPNTLNTAQTEQTIKKVIPPVVSASHPVNAQADSKITEIDGVKYVDNEYLEDKEFNIEGRKRFYIMPDSSIAGSARFETVEREKGITKSVLSKFLKKKTVDSTPVALAPTYYRLPKDQVTATLEQSCFTGKKIEKAKELSLKNQEIGFWPVPPIKEKFVYDVIKLDPQVENIHFSSYASSQKNPSYYWPLVVFLDQQGCVIEGVSGFKNQDTVSNNIQYSALEGVLKKPNLASYMFMTPLAESIDVQHVKLSNKGQVKLSVLR